MIKLNGHIITPTVFPDQTSQVWKLPSELLDAPSFDVEWRFENEGEFMHLAQLKVLLERYPRPARLYLPSLPYGRQDKVVHNEATFALARFFLGREAEATDDAGRNLWGSGCENEVTGVCRHIPVPAQCPRCEGKRFISYSPFPSESGPYVFGAKSRCRKCGWVADDRPDEFQPPYTPGESS